MLNNLIRSFLLILIIISLVSTGRSSAQCIVINEVCSHGAGGCDGACEPNTSEWIEIYNTCNYPVDISCYVITSGRYAATIPKGTVMPAHGFYVIGSSNSGGSVNLDLGTCGCTTGTLVGVLTNSADQVILTDNTGTIQDAIYYGGGARWPLNITSSSSGGCSPVTISVSGPTSKFEAVPSTSSSGNKGCSVGRTCDGSSTWQVRCGAAITMGSSNGLPLFPDFTVSDSVICTGTCINFTDKTTGGTPSGWSWTFTGANTTSSSSPSPSNICYNTSGNFDVNLNVTNACGTFPLTKSGYIKVSSSQTPVISGNASFCTGGSTVLQTSSSGTYQWNLNGNPINGATKQTYTATSAGSYSLTLSAGTCSGTSNTIVVTVSSPPTPAIAAGGPVSFCSGGNVTLSTGASYSTYQWNLNGSPVAGATGQQYVANASGDYTLTVSSSGGCSGTSTKITVTVNNAPTPIITGSTTFCSGGSSVLQTSSTGLFQWSLNGVPINGAANNQYTATGAGDYTVTVSSGGCAGTSAPFTITISNSLSPAISVQGSPSFCTGGSVVLSSSGTYTGYLWSKDGTPILPAATNQQYIATAAGSYTLSVLASGGCTGTSVPVIVTIDPAPAALITPQGSTQLCNGGTVILDGGPGFNSYHWWLNGNAIPGATAQTFTASASGDYQLRIDNNSGCADTSDKLTVTDLSANPLVISSSTGSFTICGNQTLTLSVDNTFSLYQWSHDKTVIPGATANSYLASAAGIYSVSVTTSGGCADTSLPATVTAVATPTASITPGTVPPSCSADPVTLISSNADTYQWLADNSPIAGATSGTYRAAKSGSYTVIVSNGVGCSATSTATTVTFFPEASVQIDPSANNVCEGTTITLSLSSADYTVINWSSGETTPEISVTTSGNYMVSVTDANGCSASDAADIVFNPPPAVNAGPDVTTECDNGVLLSGSGSGTLSWQPPLGLSDAGIAMPMANPSATTTYTLTAANGSCTTTDEVVVTITCDFIVVPNAFSPNSDGFNDIFKAMGRNIANFDMKIFNRWGEMVFESSNPDIGWDGTYKNQPEDVGVFVWVINATNPEGKKLLINGKNGGNVTLLR